MSKEFFLEDEILITESGDKTVRLTNQRIQYNESEFGRAHIISIMLEKISSIEVHYRSWILMIILAGLSIIFGLGIGLSQNNPTFILGGITLGVIFSLIYLSTRKHVVSVASDGGTKITFQTKGMKREALLKFINEIEQAKANKQRSIVQI